jgi:hypothetical protein
MYVNGELRGAADGFFPMAPTNANYIGKSAWVGDALYVGSIDSLLIYPWILGPSEVSALFRSTTAVVCTTYLHMDPALMQNVYVLLLLGHF